MDDLKTIISKTLNQYQILKINKKILFNFYLWYDINKIKLFV